MTADAARPIPVGPPVVTVEGMRALERAAEAAGSPPAILMRNAGGAVAAWIAARAQERARQGPQALLCLVGPGNNGGDGLVAAADLRRRGWEVAAALWNRRLPDDWPLAEARAAGVRIWSAADDPDRAAAELRPGPLVLDALFGIGRSRAFAADLAGFLRTIRRAAPREAVIALDTPSGVDCDTGEADPATLPAAVTLTLGAPKLGLLRFPAAELVGELVTLPIGLPASAGADVPLRLLTDEWVAALLPPRPLHANKGTFGKAALVAGSASYPGAAALAAAAAGRAGAGLVTLASTRRVGLVVASRVLEATHVELPETEAGGIDGAGARALLEAIEGYDSLLIGPGLGRAPGTSRLVDEALAGWRAAGRRAVIDADALNLLSARPEWWRDLDEGNVLTPHPGEMARLMGGGDPREIDRERFRIAPERAARWRQVVVLKGAHTVAAAPDGRAAVSPIATPALATAGTGDVLAGTIAGLMAQGLDGWPAALAGVFIHARAGLRVAGRLGEAGAVAGDLLAELPLAQQALRDAGR